MPSAAALRSTAAADAEGDDGERDTALRQTAEVEVDDVHPGRSTGGPPTSSINRNTSADDPNHIDFGRELG